MTTIDSTNMHVYIIRVVLNEEIFQPIFENGVAKDYFTSVYLQDVFRYKQLFICWQFPRYWNKDYGIIAEDSRGGFRLIQSE